MFANPFLIDEPGRRRRAARAAAADARGRAPREARRHATAASCTSSASSTRPAARRCRRSRSRGSARWSSPAAATRRAALASQVIGAVGTDNYGLSGLEQSLEKHAARHRRQAPRREGRPRRAGSIVDVKRAQPGRGPPADASTPRIQERTEAVLQRWARPTSRKGATALVMDPRNGEVLAMANWPRVDANNIGGAPAYARQNRAVGSSYEPGSTFKAFTVAGRDGGGPRHAEHAVRAAADHPGGRPRDQGGARRRRRHADHRRDPRPVVERGHRDDRPEDGDQKFDKWVRRFGFGRATGIDLPGEEAGIVLRPEDYSGSSIGNLPIGQGLSVTPMQMAHGYSAIANGGIAAPPARRAGDRRRRAGASCRRGPPTRWRSMLEGVLEAGGTASEAAIAGLHARRQDGHRAEGRRTAATRRPTSWRRSSASRRHATRACSCR